jgi:hypothetical protein
MREKKETKEKEKKGKIKLKGAIGGNICESVEEEKYHFGGGDIVFRPINRPLAKIQHVGSAQYFYVSINL